MRQCITLSSVVIGMTAFFSMLAGPKDPLGSFLSSDSGTCKQDLELRGRLSQLLKIVCDQFVLCQSYSIGMHAGYARAVLDKQSWENKLYNSYNEHIHLLYINKKIASEDDYLIFNTKNQFSQLEQGKYVANEENRDYQLNQLSKRLRENCLKIVESEAD